VAVTFATYHYCLSHRGVNNPTHRCSGDVRLLCHQYTSVAAVISLTERRSLRKIWSECYFWSFPYYLVGAGLVE